LVFHVTTARIEWLRRLAGESVGTMPKDAVRVVNTMFQPEELETLFAKDEFRQAMADFDGTPEGVQRLSELGTSILLPEEKRPELGKTIRPQAD
jgi:hypothetical protein